MKKLILLLFIYGCAAKQKEPTLNEIHKQYFAARNDLFNRMPIDTSDIVFVGNSIIEGFPVSELFGSFKVKNRGVSGNKINDVTARIVDILKYKPKKIFLMIGINDLKDGEDVQIILDDFLQLIKKIRDKTSLYVISILPVGGQYEHLTPDIENINTRISKLYGIKFIDAYEYLEQDFESMTYDGMHLNGLGYIRLTKFLKPYVEKGL
jgi:lysophospholipase L1-like esterase